MRRELTEVQRKLLPANTLCTRFYLPRGFLSPSLELRSDCWKIRFVTTARAVGHHCVLKHQLAITLLVADDLVSFAPGNHVPPVYFSLRCYEKLPNHEAKLWHTKYSWLGCGLLQKWQLPN